MKCEKVKQLLLDTCLRTSENGEVSWMTNISIKGKLSEEGPVQVFSNYLGGVDDCLFEVEEAVKILNLQKEKQV